MASARYTLNIKKEDLQPEEEVVLTEKEKRANWLHYHKWMLIGLAALAVGVGLFIYDLVTRVVPDYTVAIVTISPVPEEMRTSLATALEAYLPDVNGDGRSVVDVQHYSMDYGDSALHNSQDPQLRMAAELRMTTDITAGTSSIFITDNFAAMQDATELFALLDSPYEDPTGEDLHAYDRLSLNWEDSELLTSLPLEGTVLSVKSGDIEEAQDFFAQCKIALRVAYDLNDDERAAAFANCVALFDQARGIE